MGIRFACHHCNHPLNLKDFQAGKRGKCPACSKSFRIPKESCDYSIPLEESNSQLTTSAPAVIEEKIKTASASAVVREPKHPLSSKKTNPSTKSNPKIAVKNRTLTPLSTIASHDLGGASESKLPEEPTNPGDAVALEKPLSPQNGALEDAELGVAAFQANPLAQWYVRPPSGGQYGPADSKLLFQWIFENRVTADSLIWFDGLTQWTAARAVLPELFSYTGPASPTSKSIPDFISPHTQNEGLASPRELVNTASVEIASKPIRSRHKQRRNQWIIIAILVFLCLCLLAGLAAVLILKT